MARRSHGAGHGDFHLGFSAAPAWQPYDHPPGRSVRRQYFRRLRRIRHPPARGGSDRRTFRPSRLLWRGRWRRMGRRPALRRRDSRAGTKGRGRGISPDALRPHRRGERGGQGAHPVHRPRFRHHPRRRDRWPVPQPLRPAPPPADRRRGPDRPVIEHARPGHRRHPGRHRSTRPFPDRRALSRHCTGRPLA